MLLQYFFDDRLAQASYLIGCEAAGQALVVDPARDIRPYLAMAKQKGLKITHVVETHIHADFVSGCRELASATGATILLSAMGGPDWSYKYASEPQVQLLNDGDQFQIGKIRVEVLHTPGHTPEHISLLVTDTAHADQPIGLFSGDCLFVGDVGRPDLLEAVGGGAESKKIGAQQQFASLKRLSRLPDYLQIWPGHGAGSPCGKALGAIPSTTLGYEKRFNPAFQFDQAEAFTDWLIQGQPDAPAYFAQMKKVNKRGPKLLSELVEPKALTRPEIDAAIEEGDLVFDLRKLDQFAAGHIPGSVSVPASSTTFSTYIGWLVDYTRPSFLVVEHAEQAEPLLNALRAIGVDNLPGYAIGVEEPTETLATVDVAQLGELLANDEAVVIDVRSQSEYEKQHLPEALHIPLGQLTRRFAEIPHGRLLITLCASGYRSQIAASLLRIGGFTEVATLRDSKGEWKQLVEQLTLAEA